MAESTEVAATEPTPADDAPPPPPPAPSPPLDARRVALAAVVLAALVYCLSWWTSYLSPTAGGELFWMSPVSRDLLPYRDYFYQAPPGLVLIARALGAVFGAKLIAAYAFGVALAVTATALTYDLLARAHRPSAAALGAFSALVLASVDGADTPFYYNHLAVSFVVVGAWALVRCVDRDEAPPLGLAALGGASLALGGGIKQTVMLGVVATAAAVLALCAGRHDRRATLRVALAATAGAVAVALLLVGWMAAHGLIAAFIDQSLVRGPSAKGGLFTSLARPVSMALALPSSEPLTLLAWLCAGLLFAWLRLGSSPSLAARVEPLRPYLPAVGAVALVALAAFVGWRLDHVPLRYVTLFVPALALWGSLALLVHHLLELNRDARSRAALLGLVFTACAVGCAWSLGVSWPLFEMMAFPSAAVLIAAVYDRADARGRGAVLVTVALLVAVAAERKQESPYEWGRWREPPLRASTVEMTTPGLEGFTLSPATATFYRDIVGAIRANSGPDDRLLAYPNLAILYGLAERRPATRGLNHWVDVCPDFLALEDAARLRANPPRIIVRRLDPLSAVRLEEHLYRNDAESGVRVLRATLDEVLRGYTLLGTYRGQSTEPIEVWVRRDAPPPAG